MKPSQQLWRTLVRVTEVKQPHFYVVVPGYDANEVIKLELQALPDDIRSFVINGQERIHAMINIGADKVEDLVFKWWEA